MKAAEKRKIAEKTLAVVMETIATLENETNESDIDDAGLGVNDNIMTALDELQEARTSLKSDIMDNDFEDDDDAEDDAEDGDSEKDEDEKETVEE